MQLVVGTNYPEVPDRGDRPSNSPHRRWPSTVHAVDSLEEREPYRSLCGTFVIYRYFEDEWPPSIEEDRCAECLRVTAG